MDMLYAQIHSIWLRKDMSLNYNPPNHCKYHTQYHHSTHFEWSYGHLLPRQNSSAQHVGDVPVQHGHIPLLGPTACRQKSKIISPDKCFSTYLYMHNTPLQTKQCQSIQGKSTVFSVVMYTYSLAEPASGLRKRLMAYMQPSSLFTQRYTAPNSPTPIRPSSRNSLS